MQIDTIDPTADSSWEEFVLRMPSTTVFHSTAWARVLRGTYGFEATYLVARRSGTIAGGIPLMQVNGSRLVGLPFSDLCPPLFEDDKAAAALLKTATEELGNGTRAIEVRGAMDVDVAPFGLQAHAAFVRHVVQMDHDLDGLRKRCNPAIFRNQRKAERSGVAARLTADKTDMARFYELQVATRKRHGLIPQPWRFFENIHRHFVEDGNGFLLLAEYGGQPIAGDLILRYEGTAVGKINASNERARQLGANQLLVARSLELVHSLGCREFDLGRSDLDGEGLRRFKKHCGGVEEPLPYYYYPSVPAGVAQFAGSSIKRRALALAVRFAPLWALRQAGSALYKYAA